jgi:hypothetical protein
MISALIMLVQSSQIRWTFYIDPLYNILASSISTAKEHCTIHHGLAWGVQYHGHNQQSEMININQDDIFSPTSQLDNPSRHRQDM